MEIHCVDCKTIVLAQNLDITADKGNCPSCGTHFLISRAVAKNVDTTHKKGALPDKGLDIQRVVFEKKHLKNTCFCPF